MRYYIRAGIVVAFHADDQKVDPSRYGPGTYVIVTPGGKSPLPDDSGNVPMPQITPAIRAASCKDECSRRIGARVSETTQRNLTAYGVQLTTLAIAGAITEPQSADLARLTAIYAWIGRPHGMQGACDALIGSADDWWSDSVWPEWDAAWDDLVARF